MNETLCMGCMQDRGDSKICPFCGYEEGTPHIPSYLPPRTMIGNRYLVGKVLSYNGEGVKYIGFDTMSHKRVDIREYFPDTLAVREADGKTVRVMEGRQIAYKANMGDYTEMFQKLIRMRTLSCLVQTTCVLEENHTAYAVQEHLEAVSLREYLRRKETMLTWQEASDLLMPAVRTLNLLHQDGVLHRGLSVDTLFVTDKGHIKIGGFSISAARAARTELAAELFPGYSALEQYSSVSPHGTWTDVYGICAVFYKALTGQRPPEALIRSADKELMNPRERNETIPEFVSEALLKGLSLESRERIQNMEQLTEYFSGVPEEQEMAVKIARAAIKEETNISEPYQQDESKTVYYHPAVAEKNSLKPGDRISADDEPASAEIEKMRKRNLMMKSMIIALPILLLILILTLWLLFGGRDKKNPDHEQDSSDSSSTVASEEWLVPSYPESSGNSESSGSSVGKDENTSSSKESSSESSREELVKVDDFEGEKYDNVIKNPQFKKWYKFGKPEYEYDDKQPEGYVIKQNIPSGTKVEKGTEIILTVSKGKKLIELPDYKNLLEKEYLKMLDDLEIPYKVVYVSESKIPPGLVVGTNAEKDEYDPDSKEPLEVRVAK